MKSLLTLFFFLSSTSWAASPSCSLFSKSAGPLEVRVLFGYKDARPARFVGDRHERTAFVEKLTAPCQSENMACGFLRDPYDSESFYKSFTMNGRTRAVHAVVVNSSVGTDDEENRRDPYQAVKSARAADVFMSGLRSADVVLYNGHSRFGGGPDFDPPLLRPDGRIDSSFYAKNKVSFKHMLANLAAGHLQLLGLFSCTSTQHFDSGIHRVSHARLVSSRVLMYYSDAMRDSLQTLDEILHGQCARSF